MPDPAATSQFFTNLFGLESQNGVLVDKSEMSFAKLHATTSDKKSRTGRGTIDHIAYTLETKEAVDELHDLAVRELNSQVLAPVLLSTNRSKQWAKD
ncbi:PyrE-like protein [Listeria monocytogenes N53-1]|nr:PyrE-like protein [Listeria monocytogenes N53-1]